MTVRVGKFEKISIAQAVNDGLSCNAYDNIKLPKRATKGSAGYDIVALQHIKLNPGESLKVATGLKCKIDNGWFLGIFPKSGLGFKFHTTLANTVGIVDEDYFDNDTNEGHIWVKLCNEGDKVLEIDAGKAFCQGIFLPYGITYDDTVNDIRKGGLGSTGK